MSKLKSLPKPPYSRLYWGLIDDAKFVDVYTDDHAFALWARLLITADMAWPASAALPFGTRRAALGLLVDVRLVDLLANGRYRIHGLDAERGRRQQQAKAAAAARWDDDSDAGAFDDGMPPHPVSNAESMRQHPVSNAESMPSKAKHRRAEQSIAEQVGARDGLNHITPVVQDAGEAITGRGIGGAGHRQLTELDRLVESHGPDAVVAAFGFVANGGRLEWRQLVWGAMKHLEPIPEASRPGRKPKGMLPSIEEVRRAFEPR